MSLFSRGDTWWVDIRHKNQRIRKTTGTSDRAEAQRVHDELKAALWRNKYLGEKIPHSFAQAVDKWCAEHTEKRSIETDAHRLLWLVERIGDLQLDQIDEEVVEELIELKKAEKFQGRAISNSTVNRTLSALSVIFKAAVAWRWLERVPPIRRLTEADSTPRFFSREQVVAMVSNLPLPHACIFSFALATGQRASNVLNLRWQEVDLENCCFWILGENFKNGQAMNVPLNAEALAVLKLCEGWHDEYVFVARGHKPLKRISGDAWYRAMDKSGIPRGGRKNFTFHHTRHTWASFHMMNGTPKEVLLALGGWKTANMVERYAHLAPGFAAQYAGNTKINR
jgi:integrase